MEDFSPVKALKTLRKAIKSIEEVGAEVQQKRIELSVAKAAHMDALQEARRKIFKGEADVQASRQRDWIAFETFIEDRAHEMAKDNFRIANDKLNVIIEVLNATKIAFRIAEMEIKNLNLPVNGQTG